MMVSEKEIENSLERVEKILTGIKKLNNRPKQLDFESITYQRLIIQKDFFKWILGHPGYDINSFYKSLEEDIINLNK